MSKKENKYLLTHPEKILYPEKKITKLMLAEYYDSILEWILPHIINRPLTLVRCPDGRTGQCFYQRHLGKFPKSNENLYGVDIRVKEGKEEYIYIKNSKGLFQLVQMGILEIHTWGCKVDKPEKPDIMIFDLDPGPGVTWAKVVKAAHFIRDELADYNLQSFVKTTGGKGLHIVIPIQRRYSWDQMVEFSQIFVQYLVEKHPTEYIGTMAKSKREGKIFVDYLRNHRTSTAVAPYSTRARENAPVAMPLSWEELTPKIKPNQFTVLNTIKRLKSLKVDPWADFYLIKQVLPKIN